ncbi:MAG: hypoxanthine phosphoribosyltransferase [Candidatus Eremiobacteraeota bacterium]|nr:hypoxanthine phosphoribosyltransferase [Candidatus Eremiobacteraeota bacterium]
MAEERVGQVVFEAEEIAAAVRRLARAIAADASGEPLLLVGVLKGALFFVADLARALPPSLDVRVDYVAAASYGDSHRSSGQVRLLKDTSQSVEGKQVVLVEDIVENGWTLQYLSGLFQARRPASLRSCTLLDKPYHRRTEVAPTYVGLRVPDAFIVGYGLDYQEKYRHLPYLAKIAPCASGETRGRPGNKEA